MTNAINKYLSSNLQFLNKATVMLSCLDRPVFLSCMSPSLSVLLRKENSVYLWQVYLKMAMASKGSYWSQGIGAYL